MQTEGHTVTNPLQRVRDKHEAQRLRRFARLKRRQLSAEVQDYTDRIASSIWAEYGDIGQAHAITEKIVRRDAESKGFDPQTVILIIQLALLIYQTLKRLNVMSPSTEIVTALFEGE